MKIMGLDIEIKAALEKAFAANTLEVINESHKHSGHSGTMDRVRAIGGL